MSQQQLRTTYNGLKDDFTTTQANTQMRIQAQQQLNHSHFEKSMQTLEDQFAEAERQRKLQQKLLKKHYEHQKYLMKKRHEELLFIKSKLSDVNSHEQHQMATEQNLQQKHQSLLDIQRDYAMRSEKVNSNRDNLEQRKKTILDEMKEFDVLTQSMGQLTLNGDLNEQQKQQLDEFMLKHPQTAMSINDMDTPQSSICSTDHHSINDYHPKYQTSVSRNSRNRRKSKTMHRRSRSQDNSIQIRPSSRRRRRSRRRSSAHSSHFTIRSRSPKQPKTISRKSRTRSVKPSVVRTRSRSIKRRKSKSASRVSRRKSRSQKRRKSYSGKRSGNLYVRLVHARGVFGKQGSRPNTYVELHCGDDRFTSSTIRNNNNPKWNEFFKFYVRDYDKQILTLRLVDARNGRTITKMRLPVYEFVDRSRSNKSKNRNKDYESLDNKNCSINMDVSYENKKQTSCP